jgi:hypothetical protein
MTGYSIDVVVMEIKADIDPFTGEGTQVTFGYRIPVPAPPVPSGIMMPKQIAYKHAMHLFIPKDRWVGQFGMWEECHLIVSDDGKIELKKV